MTSNRRSLVVLALLLAGLVQAGTAEQQARTAEQQANTAEQQAGAPSQPATPQSAGNPQPPPSQTQPGDPQATFRAGINYVAVDVIVTDKKDNPVIDLKKEEFEVFEDGKPQPI